MKRLVLESQRMMAKRLAWRVNLALVAGVLLLAASGCSSAPVGTLPELFPVKGTVKRAGKPLADCLLRFRGETDDPNLTITAATDAEGRFEAGTMTVLGNVRKLGVPQGTYQVTIDLPLGADQSGGGAVQIAAPQRVQAGENSFEFDVAKR